MAIPLPIGVTVQAQACNVLSCSLAKACPVGNSPSSFCCGLLVPICQTPSMAALLVLHKLAKQPLPIKAGAILRSSHSRMGQSVSSKNAIIYERKDNVLQFLTSRTCFR